MNGMSEDLSRGHTSHGLLDRAGGQVYVRRCTVMYVAVYATFGGYQPLLATLPDFALYFVCMVLGRQIKLQNMFILILECNEHLKLFLKTELNRQTKYYCSN